MQQIQDPRLIPQTDLPVIILAEKKNDFISFLIDFKTNSSYDHTMLSINQGKVFTQGFSGYHEIPIDGYLKEGGQLKFVKLLNGTEAFNNCFRSSVINRLNSPWYHKCYDFLGIIGQAIGCPWIHTPGLEYCSVDVIRHLKDACCYLPLADRNVILAIPPESSPKDLDMIIRANPQVFSIYGWWESDFGVIV